MSLAKSNRLVECPYSGKTLPRKLCDKEHIIPRALGGRGQQQIWVEKTTNSELGSKVDAALMQDVAFQFARYRHRVKGATNKEPRFILRNAMAARERKSGFRQKLRTPLSIVGEGGKPLGVYDAKRKQLLPAAFSKDAYVFEANIEHIARLKFALKVLLGLNRALFLDRLGNHLDIPYIRKTLLGNIGMRVGQGFNGITFAHPFLVDASDEEKLRVSSIQKLVEHENLARVLALEDSNHLEWSVAVLGTMVCTARLPKSGILFPDLATDTGLMITWENGKPDVTTTVQIDRQA